MEVKLSAHTAVMSLFLIICSLQAAYCWHESGDNNIHCWDFAGSGPIECTGLEPRWIEVPGDEIRAQLDFNTTCELIVTDAFYEWAFTMGYFGHLSSVTSAAEAKTWCETTECPSMAMHATKHNCCIYHVNMHSCALATSHMGYCTPWMHSGAGMFAHSNVLIGKPDRGNWTSSIDGMFEVGATSIIAHYKIAGVNMAIEKETNVLPRIVCGDDLCEKTGGDDSETCETCPADCGRCPLEVWEIGAIGGACGFFLACLAGIYCYMQWQRRKLLWNEDWIISPDKIADDEGLHGAFGSMVVSNVGLQSVVSQQASNINAGHKQVFCRTALYDGRSCAVRTVTKPEFSLSKQVRIEVRAVRECDHPNLCKFVGACIQVPHMCVLSEYTAKGSLSDVLLNEEIPVNWAFRFSFESDIASGMKYLHSRGIITDI